MSTTPALCPNCQEPLSPGARYCPRCGEAVEPKLVADLQWLYRSITDLDARIQAGEGQKPLSALRDEYRTRYLTLRTAPTAAPAPATVPLATTPAASAPAPWPIAAAAAPFPAAPAPQTPPGPAFSWRAFLADQAITIMAYLGGFLLLIATLSFEVGGIGGLVVAPEFKLAVVCVVYVAFGALGLGLRRLPHLRTVGGAYLGVFALMTPLVGLAFYLFKLRGLGFPIAGVLSLSAAYATVIYLALAWRTAFATYAYLSWTALVVAALAGVPWARAGGEWTFFALACASLALVAQPRLRRIPALAPALAGAVRPALQLGALTTVVAVVGTEALGINLAVAGRATGAPSLAAFALAACALVPLAALASLAAHGAGAALPQSTDAVNLLDLADWSVAATAAQAAAGVAAWAGADHRALAYVLALAALGVFGGALLLWRHVPARASLRWLLEGLALALVVVGALLVADAPAPNWSLAAALTAGLIVTLGMGLLEGRWWLLAAGAFLSLDYHTLVYALFPDQLRSSTELLPTLFAALALALWLGALLLGLLWPRLRPYADPLFLVALGDALYVVTQLSGLDASYATAMLAAFAVAALAAGRLARQPRVGGAVTGFFGLLAVQPLTFSVVHGIGDTVDGNRDGAVVALVALVAALAALGVRRALGREWAYAPYVVALWAAFLAGTQLQRPGVSTREIVWLGAPFAAALLLAVALLAAVAAWWEDRPWTMSVPALLALWAFGLTRQPVASVVLVFALLAVGVGLWQVRGRGWGVAWRVAAALASPVAVVRLGDVGAAAPHWQVALLFAFAFAAYLSAVQERQPWLTALAVVYAAFAVGTLPGPHNLAPTLILTFGAAALGALLRLRGVALRWVLAIYAAGVVASLFAVFRVEPQHAGMVEALLLIFAAVAYGIAVLERQPLVGAAPAAYVAGAVLAQPDAHALLPLSLALALLGLVLGRIGGAQWAWPGYLSAAVAGVFAATLGTGSPRFEALALLALALMAYAIAAAESRPDVLPLAFVAGGLSLAAAASFLRWEGWQTVLAFAGLAWLFVALQWVWAAIPWLRPRGGVWWERTSTVPGQPACQRDPRRTGVALHQWAGSALAVGTAAAAIVRPAGFEPHAASTQAAAVALLSAAAILAAQARLAGPRIVWYLAGELVALAITWEARWLGADNLQAYVLAPGSYQLLIGALLPADAQVGRPARLGQLASLVGSLLLLVPTLIQAFTSGHELVYGGFMALEALVVVGVGVGSRSRLLVLVGSSFVGIAAIRGALLAVDSGVPIALVIAAIALLLMGGATWLSTRARREQGQGGR